MDIRNEVGTIVSRYTIGMVQEDLLEKLVKLIEKAQQEVREEQVKSLNPKEGDIFVIRIPSGIGADYGASLLSLTKNTISRISGLSKEKFEAMCMSQDFDFNLLSDAEIKKFKDMLKLRPKSKPVRKSTKKVANP